jgi:hypothetical protein
MTLKHPTPTNGRCQCGAPLMWESRETPIGKRTLAFCISTACGLITAAAHDPEPENALQAFLLGEDQPPEREPVHEWDFNG